MFHELKSLITQSNRSTRSSSMDHPGPRQMAAPARVTMVREEVARRQWVHRRRLETTASPSSSHQSHRHSSNRTRSAVNRSNNFRQRNKNEEFLAPISRKGDEGKKRNMGIDKREQQTDKLMMKSESKKTNKQI